MFLQSGLPLAMLFSIDEEERKSLANSFTGIAMKYRDQVDFATVNAEKHSFLLKHFNLNLDYLPAFVIQTADEVFKFEQSSPITAHAIDEFIRQAIHPINRI